MARPTSNSVYLQHGPDAEAGCWPEDRDPTPTLVIESAGFELLVFPAADRVDDVRVFDPEHVRFARELASAASEYAAQMERLAAAQQKPLDTETKPAA
jgi:hypothetical protein